MTAVRIARGVTGRERVVKFAGCYHGHSDALLAAGGSGVATFGLADSAGVPPPPWPRRSSCPTTSCPSSTSGSPASSSSRSRRTWDSSPPAPGFLAGLRRACDDVGALLIFDEVITGFRIGPAGAAGRYGVRPDLYCFGKVIGGGLPLAAVGGSAAAMGVLAPLGPVYQAGTLSGNPLATAAGLAVLELLTPSVYEELAAVVAAARRQGSAARCAAPVSPSRCPSSRRSAASSSRTRR